MPNHVTNCGRCGRLRWTAIAVVAVLGFAAPTEADPVLDWNALALDCVRTDNTSPPLSTRNLAILHTAIYDAVNSITRTHQPYRFQLDAPAGASTESAVVSAAYEIILELYLSQASWVDDLYESWLAATPPTSAVTNGLALGHTVAWLVLLSRNADGSSTEVPYIPSDPPGQGTGPAAAMVLGVFRLDKSERGCLIARRWNGVHKQP